jgi:hypothetical protein
MLFAQYDWPTDIPSASGVSFVVVIDSKGAGVLPETMGTAGADVTGVADTGDKDGGGVGIISTGASVIQSFASQAVIPTQQ